MTISVMSPSVRQSRRPGEESVMVPVYGDHDSVQGSLSLDSQAFPTEGGRIVLSVCFSSSSYSSIVDDMCRWRVFSSTYRPCPQPKLAPVKSRRESIDMYFIMTRP